MSDETSARTIAKLKQSTAQSLLIQIDNDGKLVTLDWDYVERVAETWADGNRSLPAASARFFLAIREQVRKDCAAEFARNSGQEPLVDAVKALFSEKFYEGGKVKNGVAVRLLARMTILKWRAGLAAANDPFVASARALLGC